MEIRDCLPLMTKFYLSRIVDSIFKENIPKGSEDQLIERIDQNSEYLSNPKRVREALNLKQMPRTHRILTHCTLSLLLEQNDLAATEEDLFNQVTAHEQWITDKANDPAAFAYSDKHALDVYRTVLEVALQDADVSEDEFALLERLRQKLKISRLEHCLLESDLGMFPKKGNALHTFEEFRQVNIDLQKRGILFFLNKADPQVLALPVEIGKQVAAFLKFEMRAQAQKLLHETLTMDQLRSVCRDLGLPSSGTKAQLSERLLEAQAKPSEILAAFSNEDLSQICRKLPGVAVSGPKSRLIQNIIDYFASLTAKSPVDTEDPRETAYQYFEELAARNNKELYRSGLINKDRQMEDQFEQATRFLFEKKLGCKLLELSGTERPDGGVAFANGELLLWDNKGKEQEYRFPKSHADQFLRYIRESQKRVNVFLIIVPEIAKEAEHQAIRLKYRNETDTDIALITARDLKYLAETWPKFTKNNEPFDLNVFNTTGLLDRNTLDQRMKLLLG